MNQSFKVSQYTSYFEEEEVSVLYNGYSGALARLDPENVKTVKDLIAGESNPGSLPEKLIEQLKYGGFIVDSRFDERRIMSIKFGLQNLQLSWLACTVVITEECNFACPYCYQAFDEKPGEISDEVIAKFVEYVNESTKTDVKRFTLSLYGGEPLLYPDSCRTIAGEVKKVCTKNGAEFRNMMVTNGFLIRENLEWMIDCSVDTLQITIDGPEGVHNRRRPLKGSREGTYSRIVDNCRLAADAGMKISVRVNVEKGITRHLEDEKLIHDNITIYYEPTRYDHCGNIERYYDNQDYMYEKLRTADKQKISTDWLSHRVGGCLATAYNSFVLLPDGSILKCWDEVGSPNSKSIRIGDPDFLVNAFHDWVEWNPYQNSSKCYECRLLPNCGGGCAYRAINTPDSCCQLTEGILRNLVMEKVRSHYSANNGRGVDSPRKLQG